MNEYTAPEVTIGHGFHMIGAGPSFKLRYAGHEWLTEWHYYAGPTVLSPHTGNPYNTQPPENSPFWLIAQLWKDQGERVVDGVGQWDAPPVTREYFRRIGASKFVCDKTSTDLILECHEGYEGYPILTPNP